MQTEVKCFLFLTPCLPLPSFSTLEISRSTLTFHKGCQGCPLRLCKSSCGHSGSSTCLPSITKNASHQQALGNVGSSTSERLLCLAHIRHNLCYRKLLWLAATPGRLVSWLFTWHRENEIWGIITHPHLRAGNVRSPIRISFGEWMFFSHS